MRKIAVDSFNDPLEAISRFRPDIYDLVLLDINMPRMNGFDVYRELKRLDSDANILFLTGFDVLDKEFKKVFPQLKVPRLLTKPVTIDAILDELRSKEEVELSTERG